MNKRNISLLLFLSFSIFCFAQSEQIYEVNKNTSLKSGPDSGARTILRLSKHDQVVYLDNCLKYYCRVEFNGKRGWVKKRLIDKVTIVDTPIKPEPPVQEESPIFDDQPQQEESTSQPPIKEESITAETPQQEIPPLKELSTSTNKETLEQESRWGYFMPWYGIILSLLFLGFLGYFLIGIWLKNNELSEKYGKIEDVDKDIDRRKTDFRTVEGQFETNISNLKMKKHKLKSDYETAYKQYNELVHESNLLKNDLDIAEYGVYEPQFDFETSGIFKLKIQEIREKQKELIKKSKAVLGGEGWEVNGSVAKGRAMINRQKKLMLRAFNGECDSHMKGVKWNNVRRIEERILKSVGTINKMGETQKLTISTAYSKLKLIELKLTHEYNLKKYEEKEAQRRIREQIREEEKAKRDYEKALKEAEKEENTLQRLMKFAQEKYAKASEADKLLYQSKLSELEGKLKEVQEKNQRALSMAQQTKAGHVYVISNIGSFGENVFKIGMTRRLDPMDRVKELGDASVPFRFDVHAIIYSDNAPELENKLHKHFDKFRLNHINRRREYFNVSLHEIKKVVEANYGQFEFIIEPEAKEYRESIVIREQLFAKKQAVFAKSSFPEWNSIN